MTVGAAAFSSLADGSAHCRIYMPTGSFRLGCTFQNWTYNHPLPGLHPEPLEGRGQWSEVKFENIELGWTRRGHEDRQW